MRYVENKNAPKVRFIRKNGRIIPIVAGKKSRKAEKVLNNEIDKLTYQVDLAEAGRRTVNQEGERVIIKSSFPKFFQNSEIKTKARWMNAVKKRKGADFDRIVDIADEAPKFKVATKQWFDNKNVVFKKIDGKVRPIKTKNEMEREFYSWTPKKSKKR